MSLANYAKAKFKQSFCAGEVKPATLDLMRTVAKRMGNQDVVNMLGDVTWYRNGRFNYHGAFIDPDGVQYNAHIAPIVDTLDVQRFDEFDQLVLRVNLQLIADLNAGLRLPLKSGVLSFVQNVDKELRNGGKASTCGIHAGI